MSDRLKTSEPIKSVLSDLRPSSKIVSKDELAVFLLCACGYEKMLSARSSDFPLRMYFLNNKTVGLARGLSVFEPPNSFHPLNDFPSAQMMLELFPDVGSDQLESMFSIMIITSQTQRTQPKLAKTGLKLLSAETGHVVQNLWMLVSAEGWGFSPLPGANESGCQRLLGVDSRNEIFQGACLLGPVPDPA